VKAANGFCLAHAGTGPLGERGVVLLPALALLLQQTWVQPASVSLLSPLMVRVAALRTHRNGDGRVRVLPYM
jgi:hypothetical protein